MIEIDVEDRFTIKGRGDVYTVHTSCLKEGETIKIGDTILIKQVTSYSGKAPFPSTNFKIRVTGIEYTRSFMCSDLREHRNAGILGVIVE
jgi:hypothetical protein